MKILSKPQDHTLNATYFSQFSISKFRKKNMFILKAVMLESNRLGLNLKSAFKLMLCPNISKTQFFSCGIIKAGLYSRPNRGLLRNGKFMINQISIVQAQ